MDHKKYHAHRRNRFIVIGLALFIIVVGWMDSVQTLSLIGLIAINLYGYLLMFLDKHRSKRGGTRIPESTFFLLSACLGATGVWAGMLYFRHKTAHAQFKLGVPLLLILNWAVLLRFLF